MKMLLVFFSFIYYFLLLSKLSWFLADYLINWWAFVRPIGLLIPTFLLSHLLNNFPLIAFWSRFILKFFLGHDSVIMAVIHLFFDCLLQILRPCCDNMQKMCRHLLLVCDSGNGSLQAQIHHLKIYWYRIWCCCCSEHFHDYFWDTFLHSERNNY